ncbi:MAG TPA: DUF2177 family protein [Pirellulales bacterium]
MATWKLFLIVAPVFMLVDLIYLGVIMKNFYSHELGDLARRNGASLSPRWGAAIAVYLLIPGGIVLFVRPLLGDQATLLHAFGWGALFGLVTYGIYDLTNLATLEKWTLRLSLADMAWGGVLSGTISIFMLYIDRLLTRS